MANGFTFSEDTIALPSGAWARSQRRMLRYDGRPVLGLTQGRQRCYVYPLFTPAGFTTTSESPADHPHHNSFWIGTDHFHCRLPVGAGHFEEYTYNFYVDETFQGRAAGQLIATGVTFEPATANHCRLVQQIEWRGPGEWAAPHGRIAAHEQRTLTLVRESGAYVVDVDSEVAAGEWDFTIGPTRHAWFNVRVAESMTVANGGTVGDDRGAQDATAITGGGSRWVYYEGPVGGGLRAGIAVLPYPSDHSDLSWFVTDWGVVTVGPFRTAARLVRQGECVKTRYRVVIFDDAPDVAGIARWFEAFAGS